MFDRCEQCLKRLDVTQWIELRERHHQWAGPDLESTETTKHLRFCALPCLVNWAEKRRLKLDEVIKAEPAQSDDLPF